MKYTRLLLITYIFLLTSTSAVTAAAPTAANEPTDGKLNNQINQLKEKIASRVSELNLVDKRGMIGIVEEVSGNQITLLDLDGKKRFVDVDELTKFSSTTGGAFGLSDIKKGTRISVIGLYNKQSRRLLARFVRISVDPTIISGTISAIDAKTFVVTIAMENKKEQKLDISTVTKIYSYNGEGDLARSGFSKLQVGQRLITIGFPDKQDASLLVAGRITTFPNLPKDPNILVIPPVTETTPTAKPSVNP